MTKIKELRRAQDLLQKAHDRIETHGYDINTYGKVGLQGPACYIGTVRIVAGVSAWPNKAACDDDGEELKIALGMLDKVVSRRVQREDLEEHLEDVFESADLVEEELTKSELKHYAIGRKVEVYGFQVRDGGVGVANEREVALGVFRKALTRIHREIEKTKVAT